MTKSLSEVLDGWKKIERIITLKHAEQLLNDDEPSHGIAYSAVKLPGAYILVLPVSRRVYIGSTGDLYNRRQKHKSLLKKGRNRNKNLQVAFDEDGAEEILYFPIFTKNREGAFRVEQELLDLYAGNPRLLNIATDAEVAQAGSKHSEETRAKLRAAMARRVADPAHARNISEKARQRFSDPEFRHAQSVRIKEAWKDPEKLSRMVAARWGKK